MMPTYVRGQLAYVSMNQVHSSILSTTTLDRYDEPNEAIARTVSVEVADPSLLVEENVTAARRRFMEQFL